MQRTHCHWLIIALIAIAWPKMAFAQESRMVERDGLMYEVRTITVRQPVADTQVLPQQQTVYEPKLVTELRDVPVVRWQQVTSNQWQERLQHPFGLLGPRQRTGQWIPVTRWEQRVEYVRQPVTYRSLAAETRTVSVPVRNMRFVEKQETQSLLLGPAAAFQATNTSLSSSAASSPRTSNLARFDDDKLRYGMKPTDASVWR